MENSKSVRPYAYIAINCSLTHELHTGEQRSRISEYNYRHLLD